MKASDAKKFLENYYEDDMEWMDAWCDENAKKYKTYADMAEAYNFDFSEYAIRNLRENFPNESDGAVFYFYKTYWSRMNTVVDNLYSFEEYISKF